MRKQGYISLSQIAAAAAYIRLAYIFASQLVLLRRLRGEVVGEGEIRN